MRLIPLLMSTILISLLPAIAQAKSIQWEHEPSVWHEASGVLTETVPAGTDYWRITHYGFIRDSGPFRYQERSGNFEAKVRISGNYHELYHQAGLMVRIDEKNWIKAGIEFVNGKQNISTVVTRNYSDWSVLPRKNNTPFIWLRLQRYDDTVQISYSLDGTKWIMTRLAYFPPDVPVKIGMVAAAPGKQSFKVTFDHYSVAPLESPPKED